jgi:hypothetical protein
LAGNHFARLQATAMHSYLACAEAEQEMTRLPHHKTPRINRSDRDQIRRLADDERKRLALIDAFQRWRLRTEAVLADLKNAVSILDYSIEAELRNSPTQDPQDRAFPMAAQVLMTRRDNLTATVATLSDELAASKPGGPYRSKRGTD